MTNFIPHTAVTTGVTWDLYHGDCIEVLKTLPDNSVDSIVTDPPAGINFMGKDWDKDKGGRDKWVAWMSDVAQECLRVIKPGGHALVWSLPRTSHWTGWAWENGGWEPRDKVVHLNSQGFPKNLNISKALDKSSGIKANEFKVWLQEQVSLSGLSRAAIDSACGFTMRFDTLYEQDPGNWGSSLPSPEKWGVLRGVLGITESPFDALLDGVWRGRRGELLSDNDAMSGGNFERSSNGEPVTDEAKQWDGFGTALKPAAEDWWLFRKPLDGTVASNVLTHGTGGLNIEGCRVTTQDNLNGGAYAKDGTERYDGDENYRYKREGGAGEFTQPSGRWPANVVTSHHPDCRELGVKKVSSSNTGNKSGKGVPVNCYSNYASRSLVEGYAGADGTETVTDWECVEGCPVKALDAQSGVLHSGDSSVLNRAPGNGEVLSIGNGQTGHSHGPSSGGASRFFNVFSPFVYFPKVNNVTARGKGNTHPTVKNVNLMRWLVRLITPPGGTVLDPFAGSGTTGLACIAEGFTSVLIEKEGPYVEIIKSRIGDLTPGWLRERNGQDTENSQSDDLPKSLEDLLGLGD